METKSNNHFDKNLQKAEYNIITAEVIAGVVDCSTITVRKIIKGERNGNTSLGKKILLAKIKLETGFQTLIDEVKSSI